MLRKEKDVLQVSVALISESHSDVLLTGEVSTQVRSRRQSGDYIEDRKVVCYYANWAVYRQGDAKFTPQNINPYLCTHLIYAFGGLGKDDTLVPFDEYQDIEKGGRY